MRPVSALAGIALASALACSSDEGGVDLDGLTPQRHAALFPITSGAHEGVACDSCHFSPDSFAPFSCIGCHEQAVEDAAHLGIVPGYEYGASTCYACHPRGEADGFDHEAYFPIAQGTTHQNLRCWACHKNPADRSILDCTSCHTAEKTDPRHAGVAGYEWDSQACFSCHPRADVPVPADHDQRFPIGPGTKHAGIGCAECHTDPTTHQKFDCTACHTHERTGTDANHAGVPGYAYESTACYGCHPQAQVTGLIDHSTFFPIAAGDKHAGIACSSCHPVAGDKKQLDCTSCHSHERTATDLRHTGVPSYQYASASCLGCHPNSEVVGLIDHAPYFPIAVGSRHQGASCAECHTVPGDRKAISCATCHLQAPTASQHGPVGGYGFTASLCLRCHADSQVDRVSLHLPFGISSNYKHYRDSCLECHPRLRTDKAWAADFTIPALACGPCHAQQAMDDKHRNRSGYSYTPTSCIQSGCHNDGRK